MDTPLADGRQLLRAAMNGTNERDFVRPIFSHAEARAILDALSAVEAAATVAGPGTPCHRDCGRTATFGLQVHNADGTGGATCWLCWASLIAQPRGADTTTTEETPA